MSLSGEGADELFGGYLTHRANRLAARARRIPAPLLRLGLRAVSAWPVSDEKIGFEYKVKRFLEGSLLSPERAHVYWNGTFSDAEKQALTWVALPTALNDILAGLGDRTLLGDDVAPYLWYDQSYYLPDDILNKADRMSMAHSLEVRPPFLDHRIVEFAATLPASFKIRDSRQKVILRELMRDKLPDSVLTRRKIGFDIPAHDWLRGCLQSLMVEVLLDDSSEARGLFRRDALENYIRRHLERKINVGYHLWGLMILCLWMKRWNVQPSRASESSALIEQATGIST